MKRAIVKNTKGYKP